MLSRRTFLARGAQLAIVSPWIGTTWAYVPGESRLAVIVLRGALDGIAAVPPYGEPRYRALRKDLAIGEPGADGGAMKLDGLFALHPALEQLHGLYRDGQLAIVHAVATPYRDRSHFDGQDVLENGGAQAGLPRTGWLNRALPYVGAGDHVRALAVAQNAPLILRGPSAVTTWSPSRLPGADDELYERIAELYAAAPEFSARLDEALEAKQLAADVVDLAPARSDRPAEMIDARRQRPGRLSALAAATGRFLATEDGPRIAVLESGGWDTHANQGAEQGALAARLRGLDGAIAGLKQELGRHWSHTVVLVVTEFGRTVAMNGTRGTDHGTASCALLAGGAVRGGRVIADWPGLDEAALLEERDLAPTTDLRGVLKCVLRDHLGVDQGAIDQHVFPSAGNAPVLEGLIAASNA